MNKYVNTNITSGNKRLALNYGDSAAKETPDFWDSCAMGFAKKAHLPSERKESETFLDRFSWENGETILDVGSGPGTFAIPLALRGCKVTATDFSAEMLRLLQQQAAKENSPQIECKQGRWLDIDFSETFDTVICMSSLGVISSDENHQMRLGDTLDKLRNLAKKRLIVLIPHADCHLSKEMQMVIGYEGIPAERQRIAFIFSEMVEHGLLPSLEFIEKPFRWVFKDVNEACDTLLFKSGIEKLSPDKRSRLEDYLLKTAEKTEDGSMTMAWNTKQALFVAIK